jgi:DNA-binding transcriptional ArsR family regulator
VTDWSSPAAWYDVMNQWGPSDDFYLGLVMSAGRVLDVGCGTGRLLHRTTLELTAGNLGQHLTVLEKAGLVDIEKGYQGRQARTWVRLTPAGAKALRDEIANLKRLINQVDNPASKSLADNP